MQTSSKNIVLLQEKKSTLISICKCSFICKSSENVQGRKAEEERSVFTFCSSLFPSLFPPPRSPLILKTKLKAAEKLSDLHRSSYNQLVHKLFHLLGEIRRRLEKYPHKQKKDPHLQSARDWKGWSSFFSPDNSGWAQAETIC